jgi:hypothetical protein
MIVSRLPDDVRQIDERGDLLAEFAQLGVEPGEPRAGAGSSTVIGGSGKGSGGSSTGART